MSHQYKILSIKLTPIRMQSVSSIQIPRNTSDISSLQPFVRLRPLNLPSALSFRVPSISFNKCFNNGPRVVLSPLKTSLSYSVDVKPFYKTRRLYPNITKCKVKRCKCCKNISCKSTIKSSVNGRTFNVKLSLMWTENQLM